MVAPPRSQQLSRGRIVSEAIALLDSEGATGLSMRKLAARLGVAPMSLYHHFADKSALLEAVAEAPMADLASPPPDVPWDQQLTAISASFRAITRAHPAVAWMIMVDERPQALNRIAEEVVTRLVGLGFTPADAASVLRTFVRYLIGSAVMEVSAHFAPEEVEQAFEEGLTLLLAGAAQLRAG